MSDTGVEKENFGTDGIMFIQSVSKRRKYNTHEQTDYIQAYLAKANIKEWQFTKDMLVRLRITAAKLTKRNFV